MAVYREGELCIEPREICQPFCRGDECGNAASPDLLWVRWKVITNASTPIAYLWIIVCVKNSANQAKGSKQCTSLLLSRLLMALPMLVVKSTLECHRSKKNNNFVIVCQVGL